MRINLFNLSFRSAFYALLVLAAAALSACSSDSAEMLKKIPANADFVVSGNPKLLAERFGVKIEGTEFTLPGDLSRFDDEIPDDTREYIGMILKAFDPEIGFIYGSIKSSFDPEVVFFGKVADKKSLTDLLENEAEFDADEDDGYTVYTKGRRGGIVVKGDYIWVVPFGEKPLRTVTRLLDRADDESIADVPGLKAVFDNDNIGHMAINFDGYTRLLQQELGPQMALFTSALNQFKGSWITGQFNIDGCDMHSTFRIINSNGDVVDFPMVKELDTDFLKYVPESFNMAAAAGVPSEAIEQGVQIIQSLSAFLSSNDRQMLDAILPYISAIDGTIAFAANVPFEKMARNDLFNANEFQFIAYIEFKDGKAKGFLDEIAKYLPALGLPDTALTISANTIAATIPLGYRQSMNLTLTAEDNALILSSIPLTANNKNDFQSMFKGYMGSAACIIPSLSELTAGMANFGSELQLASTKNEYSASLRITNYTGSLAEAIYLFGEGLVKAQRERYKFNWDDEMVVVEEVVEEADSAVLPVDYYYD